MMHKFTKQKIIHSESLGDILKEARLERGIDLDRASRDLNIAFKYLEALENNKVEKLPGRPYLKNFLKLYCGYLHLNFHEMWHKAVKLECRDPNKCPDIEKKYFMRWPRIIRQLLLVIIILAVVFFLIIKVKNIFSPPPLTILSPLDGYITDIRHLDITGESQKEVDIEINNKKVYVDAEGKFETSIDLQKGLNLIKIIATKRYGRSNEQEIRVLLEEEVGDESISE